jgi:hypothetical protein
LVPACPGWGVELGTQEIRKKYRKKKRMFLRFCEKNATELVRQCLIFWVDNEKES